MNEEGMTEVEIVVAEVEMTEEAEVTTGLAVEIEVEVVIAEARTEEVIAVEEVGSREETQRVVTQEAQDLLDMMMAREKGHL